MRRRLPVFGVSVPVPVSESAPLPRSKSAMLQKNCPVVATLMAPPAAPTVMTWVLETPAVVFSVPPSSMTGEPSAPRLLLAPTEIAPPLMVVVPA